MQFVHGHAHPLADALFVFSDALATVRFCALLVLSACLWHLVRREWRLALVWLLLGLTCMAAQSGLKSLFGRPRPALWEHLVMARGPSMPSGHALASAAFYPFIAFVVTRRPRRAAALIWAFALALPVYIGFGRIYLGVHWPSDVAVGWTLGAFMAWAAARLALTRAPSQATKALDA